MLVPESLTPKVTQVLSRTGKVEVLTDAHRPYGTNKASLEEIRRIREAGGWVGLPVLKSDSNFLHLQ